MVISFDNVEAEYGSVPRRKFEKQCVDILRVKMLKRTQVWYGDGVVKGFDQIEIVTLSQDHEGFVNNDLPHPCEQASLMPVFKFENAIEYLCKRYYRDVFCLALITNIPEGYSEQLVSEKLIKMVLGAYAPFSASFDQFCFAHKDRLVLRMHKDAISLYEAEKYF